MFCVQEVDRVGSSDDGLLYRSVGSAPITSLVVVRDSLLWVACGSSVHVIDCAYVANSLLKRAIYTIGFINVHQNADDELTQYWKKTSGQSNSTKRPHRRRTLTVQSYSPVCASVHPL